MNIAVISPQIYPCATGGFEIFNYYLIKEFARRGHKIWVFTCCDYNWNNDNIHIVKLRRRFPMIFISIFFNLIKLKNEVDIFHVPYTSNSTLAYPILFAHKLCGIKYVIIIHGGGMHEWKIKIIHELLFKYGSDIIAVSEIIKKEYENRSGRKIEIVPPLVPFVESEIPKDKLKQKYEFTKKGTVILSLGTIKRIKGSEILLDAFINLGKEYVKINNLKLLYVGTGVLRKVLQEQTNKKGFNQYVKFLGVIPHEQVNEIYRLADIFVIPSFFEGTPVALLEAMFNGLPIIGSNVNGINTLIKHKKNGLLFEKGNINLLTNNIKQLIEKKNLANKLGEAAKLDYSHRYTFNKMTSDHIKIYKRAIG